MRMSILKLVARISLAAVAFALLPFALAVADPAIPSLTGRVVDQAQILTNSDEQYLTQKLTDAERETGAQIVIATLPRLGQYSIETWGLALGRSWKIGRAGKDDGIIILVAPNDREMRIEVGYGLEDTITDARASSIIERMIIPAFRGGHYSLGLSDAITALVVQIKNPSATFSEPFMLGGLTAALAIAFFFACIGAVIWIAFKSMTERPLLSNPLRPEEPALPEPDPVLPADPAVPDPAASSFWGAGSSSIFGNSGRSFGGGSFGSGSSGISFSSSSSRGSSFSGGGGSFRGGGATGKW